MKTILDNEFLVVNYDESKGVLFSKWKLASENMETKQMKSQIEIFLKVVLEYKPIYFLANDSENRYIFKIDEQKWVANQTAVALIKAGIKKFALILPEELIGELATEQTVDEAGELPFEQRYVKSDEEAMKWFFQ